MALMISLDDAMDVLFSSGREFINENVWDPDYVRSELEQKCYLLREKGHRKFLQEDIDEVTDISNIAEQIRIGNLNDWLAIKRDNMQGMLELMIRENAK